MDANPSASATEPSAAGPDAVPNAGVFYRIDYRRGTLREFWWSSPGPLALLSWVVARFGGAVGGSTDDLNVESLTPFEVGEESISPELHEPFARLRLELEALGFTGPPIVHRIDDSLHRSRTTMLSLAHRESEAFARIHHRVWNKFYPAKTYLFTEIISEFRNSGFLWSLSSHPDALWPDSCRVNRIEDAAPRQLWESHRASLDQLKCSAEVISVVGCDGLRAASERHHVTLRDFHLGRGFFQPLTQADRDDMARSRATHLGTPPTADDADAEVLADIDALQNARANWRQGMLTLLVSLALFLAIGVGGDWRSTLLLVPILLFHELGHWVAMRYFGYRNLRMFFIPMFGAAVSGRHYNVAAWKKAVVSLMGPVPGIVVGNALAAVALHVESESLIHAAGMMLVINGLNLLPFLPFDGGWVVHSLLFSRHWVLEVLFRVVAIAALAAASTFVDDYLLGGLAIALTIGLADAYRMARVSHDLRRSGCDGVSSDDQTIPPEIAREIIARVKAAFPKVAPSKTIAQRTLTLFESVNAKPPGWFATTVLAGVQFLSLLLALVGPLLLVAGPDGMRGLARLYRGASTPFQPSEIRIAQGTPIGRPEPRASLIAHFSSTTEAATAYERLQPSVDPMISLLLIGSSLVVSLQAEEAVIVKWSERIAAGAVATARSRPADDDWIKRALANEAELDPETTPDSDGSDASEETDAHGDALVRLDLRCEMPTAEAARRTREAIESGNPYVGLLPPWAFAELPDDGRAVRYRSARVTFAKISAAAAAHPNVRAALQALDQEDEPEATRRRSFVLAQTDAFRSEASAWLERPNASDTALVREMLLLLDAKHPADADDDDDLASRLQAGLRPLLGGFMEAQPDGNHQLARHAANCWAFPREDNEIRIEGYEFVDLAYAAHSMVRWLVDEGCHDFHYDLWTPDDSK